MDVNKYYISDECYLDPVLGLNSGAVWPHEPPHEYSGRFIRVIEYSAFKSMEQKYLDMRDGHEHVVHKMNAECEQLRRDLAVEKTINEAFQTKSATASQSPREWTPHLVHYGVWRCPTCDSQIDSEAKPTGPCCLSCLPKAFETLQRELASYNYQEGMLFFNGEAWVTLKSFDTANARIAELEMLVRDYPSIRETNLKILDHVAANLKTATDRIKSLEDEIKEMRGND